MVKLKWKGLFLNVKEIKRKGTNLKCTKIDSFLLYNFVCVYSFDGAVLSIRAIRNIEAGEEMLHCYGE